MPVVARDLLSGGPLVYGVLLGAFGIGEEVRMPHHVLVQRLRVGHQHAQARALAAPGAAETLPGRRHRAGIAIRSEEHTSELQSLIRNSYAVFCLKTKKKRHTLM